MAENNDNGRELVEPRNVSMYPLHWSTVEALAKDGGFGNTSAALRRIVDEWLDMRQFQMMTRALLQAHLAGAITSDEIIEALISRAGLIVS